MTDDGADLSDLPSSLRGIAHGMGPRGTELVKFMQSPVALRLMATAIGKGLPAVAGLSTTLLERFGADAVGPNAVKQRIGRLARFALENSGYRLTGSRPLSGDQLFVSGATYALEGQQRAPGGAVTGSSLLRRFAESLLPGERTELRLILEALQGDGA
jgi:hypothetical protein